MRRIWWAGLAVLALLGGCARTATAQDPTNKFTMTQADGLPITAGPRGLRPGVPDAQAAVNGTDDGRLDHLAVDAITDVQDFWGQTIKGYRPVAGLNSYDSRTDGRDLCGSPPARLGNAFYFGP